MSQQDISLVSFFTSFHKTARHREREGSLGAALQARLNPAAKALSRTTALLLQQPPGFTAELFFQSHVITSSEVPKYKDSWACLGPTLLFVFFFPKGSLKDEPCKPGLDGVLWQRVQHNHLLSDSEMWPHQSKTDKLKRAFPPLNSKAKPHSTTVSLFPGMESSSFPPRRFRERKNISPGEQDGLGNPVPSQSDALLHVPGGLQAKPTKYTQ